MDLDDQLSALAAGDLDPEETRAVMAQVDADPALRRRLARHQQLQRVLTGWEVAPMTTAQRASLDATVTEALDQLGDTPLADGGGAAVVGLRPLDDDRDDEVAADPGWTTGGTAAAGPGPPDTVTDLGEERARRRGIPTWASGLVAAAAAVAVVGTVGASLSGITGGTDEAADSAETAEEMIAADQPRADLDVGDDEAEEMGAATLDELSTESAAADESREDDGADTTDEGVAGDGGRTRLLTVLVEPLVVEDLGSIDAETVSTIPARVPPSLLERAAAVLTEQDTAPLDLLTEERALIADIARDQLPTGDCLDRSLAEIRDDEVLVLVGRATYDARPAVATVVLRTDTTAGESPASVLVTTVRDESSCEVVANLVSDP